MADTVGQVVTLLSESERTRALVRELRAVLDDRFDREPKDVTDKAEATTYANVLDQIIAILNEGNNGISQMIELMANSVLPKIN